MNVATRTIARMQRYLSSLFDLREGSATDEAISQIQESVPMRGAVIWVLVCSAFIASLGLDTSSVAVIIGAMLISPLMGPILGIGLGIGIHDRRLLMAALRNFTVATVASLAASILYFLVTPFGDPTPEMLARTRPTLLDAGIAFFGGLAGIIASTRRNPTTVVPGVAIATALMPPLCTAGFGLATGRISIFFGAFYLFFINAVLISTSTYVVVRLLRFPQTSYVDPTMARRLQRYIVALVTIVMIPSAIILYDVLRDVRRRQAAELFITRHIQTANRDVIRWNMTPGAPALLKVYAVGQPVDKPELDSLNTMLASRGLQDVRLRVVSLDPTEGELTREDIVDLLQSNAASIQAQQMFTIEAERVPTDTIPITSIRQELSALAPEVTQIHYLSDEEVDSLRTLRTFMASIDAPARQKQLLAGRLEAFLKARTRADSVRVVEIITE